MRCWRRHEVTERKSDYAWAPWAYVSLDISYVWRKRRRIQPLSILSLLKEQVLYVCLDGEEKRTGTKVRLIWTVTLILALLLSSVQFNCSVMSYSLRPHELQHARPPCPSPTPGVYPNSSPSSRWCHPATSSSVFPFSSCPQSLPASGSFPMSQLFTWGGQSIGVSATASVLPMNTQD